MREIDDAAAATKDCARCGARALYWRSAVVAGDPHSIFSSRPGPVRQPAWTCMTCGYIEPHERRSTATRLA